MTTPTRQEIINAYSALDDLRDNALEWEGIKAQKQYDAVLKILPPIPQPTMAEVEWDDELHYLAEAEHPGWGKVIMLERSACPGFIRIALAKENEPTWQAVKENTLTLTGKRYTLTEVQDG